MLLFIAAAVLLVTVALMVIRPLLAPAESSPAADTPSVVDPPAADTPSGPSAVDATDRAGLEALIASRRERMERDVSEAGR
jgi:hypothetical protein